MSEMNLTPRVCIIGAGCSGITAIKNLIQAGIKNITCLEQSDQIGGNWVYSDDITHSSVCETTHLISSRKMSQYIDFPMPDTYPDYPSHDQVLRYFQEYCDRFDLNKFIRFNEFVQSIKPVNGNCWQVKTERGMDEVFDFVLIANGHHSVPRHPEFRDQFEGEYMHSHSFKNNRGFENKRVLVVGAGNSASDCAVEISRVARSVDISMRTPQYILPKFFMGKPVDALNKGFERLPRFIQSLLQKLSFRLMFGKFEDYGLQKPSHSLTSAHPTLNSELLSRIRHGKIKPKPGIKRIKGNEIVFTDRTLGQYDTLLAATGYIVSTPFFDSKLIDFSDSSRIELYLRMFHPDYPTLVFIGLVQPQGAIWPLSDLQSKLAANYIAGNWKWPANIRHLAVREADSIERSFLPCKRHNLEVHFDAFSKKLAAQIPGNAPEWKDLF